MMKIRRAPTFALFAGFWLGVSAISVQAQGSDSSFLQRLTVPSTGQVDMRVDDDGEIESVRLHTYRSEDGNSAMWTELSNSRGVGLFINAFPDRDMVPEDDAITLSMRLPSLDLECPCEPEAAGLRLYVHGRMDASVYRSQTPDVTLEKIEQQRQGRVRLVGRFSAELPFYVDLDGAPDPTDTLRVEGRFDVVSDPM